MNALLSAYSWYKANISIFVSIVGVLGALVSASSGHITWTEAGLIILAALHPSPAGAIQSPKK